MSLHLNGNEQIWNTNKMVFTPLALTPDRQFLADRTTIAFGANDVPPLLATMLFPSTSGICHDGVARQRCQLRRN